MTNLVYYQPWSLMDRWRREVDELFSGRSNASQLIWPRFHGLLTVCMAGVPYGQVKDFEAVHAGVPAADG